MSKGTRDRDRQAAKRIVEQQKAAERRRRVTIWTSVAVVAVLLIAGLTGWGVLSRQESNKASTPTTPSVAVDDGTAFAVGTGAVTVDLYEDFMCPICHEFETQSADTITKLISEKKITVRYHPVAILDRASNGTEYSTRSAAASAAAAEGGKFSEYHKILYDNQPEENSDGLTDATLIELGMSVGLGDDFATAVTDKTYTAWAGKVTDTFSSRGYTGTPTIVVNGEQLQGSNGSIPSDTQLSETVEAAAG